MKNTKIILLFIFAVSVFSTNMVFATLNPVPGVDIIVKKNPGDIVFSGQTGRDGKFSMKLEEGNYELTLPFYKIARVINSMNREYSSNPRGFDIFLEIGHRKIKINKETGVIKLTVPKGGGVISGRLTYVAPKIHLTKRKTVDFKSFSNSVDKANQNIQKIGRELSSLSRKIKDRKFEESFNNALQKKDKNQIIRLVKGTGITGDVDIDNIDSIVIHIKICWRKICIEIDIPLGRK